MRIWGWLRYWTAHRRVSCLVCKKPTVERPQGVDRKFCSRECEDDYESSAAW